MGIIEELVLYYDIFLGHEE